MFSSRFWRSIIFLGTILVVITALFYLILHRHHSNKNNTPSAQSTLVSLGDSIAAGYGLETSSDISLCGRTDESYPSLLAKTRGLQLDSLACSGATISRGLNGTQRVGSGDLPSQLSQLPSIKPTIITLTIGANDIEWTSILSRCIISECGTAKDSSDMTAKLSSLSSELQQSLELIHKQYPDTPAVYITGYYQLYPKFNSGCSVRTVLEDTELSWINETISNLNSAIRISTSKFTFANYVEPDFSAHLLCSKDSWIFDLNGPAPYHPNDKGQQAIADAITRYITGSTSL